PTPINAAIRDEVLAVARDRKPSFDRLRAFFERTRPLVTPGASVAPVTMGGDPPYPQPVSSVPVPVPSSGGPVDTNAPTMAVPVWTEPEPPPADPSSTPPTEH